MRIQIDPDRCNGCGACAEICPCDVYRLNAVSGKAKAQYEEDCWYCGACELDCPTGAIYVRLPYLI